METYFRKHPDKRPITYMGESDILIKSTNLRRGYTKPIYISFRQKSAIILITRIYIIFFGMNYTSNWYYITTFEMKDTSIVIIDHIFIYIHTYGQI